MAKTEVRADPLTKRWKLKLPLVHPVTLSALLRNGTHP